MARTGSFSKRTFLAGVLVGLSVLVGPRLLVPTPATSPRVWRLPSLVVWLFDGVPLSATYFPTPIKSITAITLSSSTTTQTVAVTKANSILIGLGTNSNQPGPQGQISAVITNDTTVTGSGGGGGGATYSALLVEFLAPFVKSQGCGAITISNPATSATATLSPAVTVAKTLVARTGVGGGGDTTSTWVVQDKVVVTNTTTLTATIDTTPAPSTSIPVGYCYLEFK